MSLLGIDVGTTGCKAAAFSADGKLLAEAYREYPTLHEGEGWAELDSRHVWRCVKEVIGTVAVETSGDPISALCVSSMGEAVTPVAEDRTILGNCILSSDTRGGKHADLLRDCFGQESFFEINPNILGAHYSLPKMLWLKEHQSDIYERADKFLLWGGLVGFMLGCDPSASYSLANRTLLFDIHAEDWSPEIADIVGMDINKLPRCLPGGDIAGTVSDVMADELGLRHGVRVVVGGHDQCCNALGAGISQAGRAVDGLGTYECITPVYDHVPEASKMLANGLNVEHHVLPGLYVSFLYNQGGSLVRWFRDTFAADSRADADIYERLIAEIPDDPTKLFVLPHFETTGSPGFISDSSGVIVGLKLTTSRGEILKAILECITFYFVESISALREMNIDTSEFVATGGGAKSDAWLQIKADILGVPVVRPKITECGLLGTAILAGVATGVFSSVDEGVSQFVERDMVFEPDSGRNAIYEERLSMYGELYPTMRGYLSGLSRKSHG